MKNNQKGFSVIEALIIIIVIGLLVGAGWYVYNRTDEQNNDAATNQGLATKDTSQEKESFKTLRNEKLNLEFKYPAEWSSDINQYEDVFSVTVSTSSVRSEGHYSAIVSGASLRVVCSNSSESNITQFKQKDIMYTESSQNSQDVTVNGVAGVEYVAGYEGPEKRTTTFYIDKQLCSISMQENVYKKPEYNKIYKQVVESVKF